MKNYLFLLVCCLPLLTFAQPQLTGSNFNPQPYEQYTVTNFGAFGFDPGASGAGVTWDFSTVQASSTDDMLALPGYVTPNGGNFPYGTIAIKNTTTGNYYYYRTTSVDFGFTGSQNPGAQNVSYDDTQSLIPYPFSYQSSHTDAFHSSYFFGYPWERNGQSTTTGDAYGTLTTPAGTFTDVLRLRIDETYADTAYYQGHQEINVIRTTYWWVKPGYHYPLFIFITGTSNGQEFAYGSYYQSMITQVGDAADEENRFSMSPSAASPGALIQVETQLDSPFEVILRDMRGSELRRVEGKRMLTLDTQGLSAGMYLVEMRHEGGRSVRKLILH